MARGGKVPGGKVPGGKVPGGTGELLGSADAQLSSFSVREVKRAVVELSRARKRRFYIRGVFTYWLFLAVLAVNVFLAFDIQTQWNTGQALKDVFLNRAIQNAYASRARQRYYEDIDTEMDWFDWVQGPLIDGLFLTENYDGGNRTTREARYVQRNNRVLGAIRFRQLRVKAEDCRHLLDVDEYQNQCYPPYSVSVEDKQPFPRGDGRWKYSSAEETGTYTWNSVTEFIVYGAGGHVIDIPFDRDIFNATVHEMRENLWIDRQTRAVFVNMNFYNSITGRYTTVQLLAEFRAPGNVIVLDTKFRTLKLDLYLSVGDKIGGAFEIIFIAFVVYYIVVFVAELRGMVDSYRNRHSGLSTQILSAFNFWNWLDLVTMILFIVIIITRILYITSPNRKAIIDGAMLGTTEYLNVEVIGSLFSAFSNFTAVTMLLSFVKTFKFLQFSPHLSLVWIVLIRAGPALFIFLTFFGIVFVAFVVMGYLIFGPEVREFRSMGIAFSTLGRMIFGEFDYQRMSLTNPYFTPVYFYSFMLLVYFVLLNMFLAILNDAYALVYNERRTGGKIDFGVFRTIRRAFLTLIGRRRRRNVLHIRLSRKELNIMSDEQISMALSASPYFQDDKAEVTLDVLQHELGPKAPNGLALFIMSKYFNDKERDLEEEGEESEEENEGDLAIDSFHNVGSHLDVIMDTVSMIHDRPELRERTRSWSDPDEEMDAHTASFFDDDDDDETYGDMSHASQRPSARRRHAFDRTEESMALLASEEDTSMSSAPKVFEFRV